MKQSCKFYGGKRAALWQAVRGARTRWSPGTSSGDQPCYFTPSAGSRYKSPQRKRAGKGGIVEGQAMIVACPALPAVASGNRLGFCTERAGPIYEDQCLRCNGGGFLSRKLLGASASRIGSARASSPRDQIQPVHSYAGRSILFPVGLARIGQIAGEGKRFNGMVIDFFHGIH